MSDAACTETIVLFSMFGCHIDATPPDFPIGHVLLPNSVCRKICKVAKLSQTTPRLSYPDSNLSGTLNLLFISICHGYQLPWQASSGY